MLFDYLSCLLGILKIFLFKILYFSRITFESIPKMNSSFKIAIKKGSKLSIGHNLRTRNNVSFRIYNEGKVFIGNDCFFNDNCSINCQKNIKIGDRVICGQNVMIYDNDHDYKRDINAYLYGDVSIGNNVWIGANCIILKGTKIGDNVVIAAGSIVKEDIEDNTLYYNKLSSNAKKINRDV